MRFDRCALSFGASALLAGAVGCLHDFSVFDPVASALSDDAGAAPAPDAGAPVHFDAGSDAHVEPTDAGKDAGAPVPEASPSEDGSSSCGADCFVEALDCAGTCAAIELSCAAACDSGAGCSCTSQETACNAQCATQCDQCTSNEGCINTSECASAAHSP